MSTTTTSRQKSVFTQYLNSYLPSTHKISSPDTLPEDLSSGLLLLHVLESLIKQNYNREANFLDSLSSTKKPNVYQKMENVRMILDYLEKEEGIDMVNLDPKNIVDGNEKLILGLVWRIINHFHVSRRAQKKASEEKEHVLEQAHSEEKAVEVLRELSELEGRFGDILKWVNSTLGEDAEVRAENMAKSWSNPELLKALIVSLGGDDARDALDGVEGDDLFQACIDYAHEHFNVPKILTVEDFHDPDKMVLSTYLAYIRDYALAKEREQILQQNQVEEERFREILESTPSKATQEEEIVENSADEEEQYPEEQPQEEAFFDEPEQEETNPYGTDSTAQESAFDPDADLSPMMRAQRQRQERIQKVTAESREQHERQVEEAQSLKERLKAERLERIQKKHQINQDEEKRQTEYMQEEPENTWEKVAKYCNFSTGDQQEKDTQRLKKLLITLKNEKK